MNLGGEIMNPVTLPKGDYALHVLEEGHVPGVLSGAELKGKARQYGGWYARKRMEVKQWAHEALGVSADYRSSRHGRQALVWVKDGRRVRLVINGGKVVVCNI